MAEIERKRKEARDRYVSKWMDEEELDEFNFFADLDDNSKHLSNISLDKSVKIAPEKMKRKDRERFTDGKYPLSTRQEFDYHNSYMDYDDDSFNDFDPFGKDPLWKEVKELKIDFFNSFEDDFDDSDI